MRKPERMVNAARLNIKLQEVGQKSLVNALQKA